MTRLFPQLPDIVAREIAASRATLAPTELAGLAAADHPAAIYAATGGNRVSIEQLGRIRGLLVTAATETGYPAPIAEGRRGLFDGTSAVIVLREMDISPAEASNPRVWSFLTCILAPDLVRWRFPGGPAGTPAERFLGGTRGIRNLLGRVWWRAYLLGTPETDPPREFLYQLGEDELVQIAERPNIAGSRRLARQLCDSFLEAIVRFPNLPRSELMREAMKRVRRLAGLLSLDALADEELMGLVDDAFDRAGHHLAGWTGP